MAKIDLTSLQWCDLVFGDKNRAYGAYKMRADSPKRHTRAMIIVIVVVAVACALPTLIELATPEQQVDDSMIEVTTLSQLDEPEVKQKEFTKPVEATPPPPALKSTIKFTAPVIKKDEEVPDEDQMKSQEELNATKTSISIADVKGNDEEHGADIADLKQVVVQAKEEPEKVFDMVEQMPSFPGGQGELMKYISKNLRYPAIAQENGIQGRVICQFVVGKDGQVRDVVVVRTLDPSCDKEAVRVLSGMPKWIPGKQNGKAVAVKYTVPIVFRLQ